MVRWLSVLLALMAACQPRFERRPSRVDGPRLLGIRSEPPEAAPGQRVRLSALWVDAEGPSQPPAERWAFCLRRRPLASSEAIAPECLEREAPWISAFDGPSAEAALPLEGCALFGPEPPPPPPGEPPLRSADPDGSGGYYQPVRLEPGGSHEAGFGRIRLQCALPQAPAKLARKLRERYVPNVNPTLTTLTVGASAVPPGTTVELRAEWSPGGADRYLRYDPRAVALEERVEKLRLSWFTTAGELEVDESDPDGEPSASNRWTAPAEPGVAHLWAVLRDDRGGVSWRHAAVEVR